jgi:hypothetical protein
VGVADGGTSEVIKHWRMKGSGKEHTARGDTDSYRSKVGMRICVGMSHDVGSSQLEVIEEKYRVSRSMLMAAALSLVSPPGTSSDIFPMGGAIGGAGVGCITFVE